LACYSSQQKAQWYLSWWNGSW